MAENGLLADFVMNPDSELDERSQQILNLEKLWWKYAGAKEQAITKQFSMSPTNYYQLLNQLIETDAALAYDPMLVKRLRRARSTKRRVGGKVGTGR
ncbi:MULTISPECIES: DUF3263 domain-containing protein [Glutamicibacter]|jgi:hypothetical protein|uniref:Uncharacterized protein DUF3263 n=1 Tax=Glutamicibacter mysorens TaxID=257984 RepID=A0ABX4MUH4_9MICC|nr:MULTISPECIES: DUF3263 domain-containing protein [Glutamicibacter]KWR74101.1 hypothetical protein RN04_02570 [Arthrobacter sp. W1]MDV2980726.1 DUF3263 domain-containing protein [Actinomycetes bacterium ARC8]MBM7767420.1 hypothetical protein [Glutamicibacter nicotianae]PJJ42856.1 uncharacterized protein DUF3263 [Glutamicibacter mysorens]QEP06262.1 DUF3263 domain-containing protein [Glutamicibacter sp. ZJUTW]